ncbi:SRPBCC family protein [Gimesia aquarii]|uniref:Polyketide cyclase / dehydrase and lipid transport n=1 Tax=Gimesia aquarii TaxID=2527964 RepID=A0A517WXU4_9PLAN|nr:SRPBCC family protein [Gimesia aquarii]QDU10076.1 Polyketide cyclase / dehydrase and lipid transport [Gimesia aquarii]
MEISYHQEIIAPIEVVFNFLTDDEKMKLWMEGLQLIEYPEEKNVDDPVGTRFIYHIKEGGHTQQYSGSVTEYTPPTLWGIELSNPAYQFNISYELTKQARKTQLDYHCEMVFGSLFHRIMGFLFRGLTKRILKSQMTKLKQLSEQESVRRSPQ